MIIITKSCKNSTKNSCISFTQGRQLLTVCSHLLYHLPFLFLFTNNSRVTIERLVFVKDILSWRVAHVQPWDTAEHWWECRAPEMEWSPHAAIKHTFVNHLESLVLDIEIIISCKMVKINSFYHSCHLFLTMLNLNIVMKIPSTTPPPTLQPYVFSNI